MTNKRFTYIPQRMKSVNKEDPYVTGAEDIDAGNGKSQQVKNTEVDDSLAFHQSEINALNNQNYVTVDSFNALPATGASDTVYRVSNWDGSQQDPSVYSEYGWDGSQYVHLSTKSKIGEVFDISAYHATGGTLATYADLSAALDSNNGGGVPQPLRKGGMSVKFVQSSDNKYVQWTLRTQNFTTNVSDWYNDYINITNDINAEINGKREYNIVPSDGKREIVSNIVVKAGVEYKLSVRANNPITASGLGVYLVDGDNNNLLSLVIIYSSESETWDGSLKERSFVSSVNTVAKITYWARDIENSSNLNIVFNQDANLEHSVDVLSEEVDNLVEELSETQLNIDGDRNYDIIQSNGSHNIETNIVIKAGIKYTLSAESEDSISATGLGYYLVDTNNHNLLSLVILYSSSSETWDGSHREVSFIAATDSIVKLTSWGRDISNPSNVKLVLNQDNNLVNFAHTNIVGTKLITNSTSTSGSELLITINRKVFINRIIRLRADALSGIKTLYGITYTDGTRNERYSYGGFCELYAEKDVREASIYVESGDNTYSGDVALFVQVCTADSGNDGLIYDASFLLRPNAAVNIKNTVELIQGHTYIIVASSNVEQSVGFFIENSGTNLYQNFATLTSNEQIVGEYTADADYLPKLTSWQPSTGVDATINYKFYDKTAMCKALWERLNIIEENNKEKKGKLFGSTVYVAASNSSNVDKLSADYVCDGYNDEVEINQAIAEVGTCGTVILLGGEYFIDSFTYYEGYGYCGIVVTKYNNGGLRSVMIKGIRHYFFGTKITVRQAAFDAVPEEAYINVFNVLSPVNINKLNANWYVSLQDMFINIPTHSRKCVIVNLENAGCGEEKNLRISAFGNSDAPENGSSATRQEKMAYNDELVGIRTFHGWTYGDTVRMDNISVWGCGEAFQLGGEHLIACDLRARYNKCGYSFGRYGLTSIYGAFDHPNTLINCCDEQSIYGPRFVFCGLIDHNKEQQYPGVPDTKLQCYTFIDFNCEQFEYPAEETTPGTFCGTIQFSSGSGTFGNNVNIQFWKNDGSGKNFRTINSSHSLGGTTALRNTYTPQYMQQYYDETLSKLLIYDGTNWVDSDGNDVDA